MTYKSFLYLTFDDGEEEKTLPCNIPFCFCASRELPCECSQLWSISFSPQFYKIFFSWFFLSQYHSHSHIIFATILQDFLFLENVSLSHICLLGDVREKVHATRKHGWKVQTGHWNCLWQLWYFSTFSVWDFGLLIHHSTGGSCDISINICLVEDCSNELCTLLISLVLFNKN